MNEEIQRGIALLDAEKPGWQDDIDFTNLDMGDHDNCILGQIYGNYSRGRMALDIFDIDDSVYGFDLPPDSEDILLYNALTEAWKEALA